jgi:oligopeptide transport system substrate-binding protein
MKRVGWIWLGLFFASAVQAKTLNLHLLDAPSTFDWNGAVTNPEAPIIHLIGEGLFQFSPITGKLTPALAESVVKSKDRKTYTFLIRKDAVWSDGKAVRAQDFVDSWIRLLSPHSTSLYAYYLFDVEGAREYHTAPNADAASVGVSAKDERTLVVKLRNPIEEWEKVPTFWPLFPIRKDALERFGDQAWRPGAILSSGPFVYDSAEPGRKITLKRNPHYARAKTNVDQVDIYFDQDLNRVYERYREGFYSFIQFLPPEKLKALSKGRDWKQPAIYRNHILIANARKYPMSIRDFRAAVMQSIDTAVLNQGREVSLTPSRNMVPVPLRGSEVAVVEKADPKEALRLLKSSGVIPTKQMKLRILTRLGEPFASMGKAIQEQIQKTLGIEVEIASLRPQEFGTYASLNDYDLIMVYWNAKIPNAKDFLYPYSSLSTQSRLKFSSPTYDQWVEQLGEGDSGEPWKKALHEAMTEYVRTQRVVLPLVDEKSAVLVSPKIKNLYFNFMGFPYLNDVILAP